MAHVPASGNAQPPSVDRARDERSWIATNVYESPQTEEAFARKTNPELVAMRRRIDELQRELDRALMQLAWEHGDRRHLDMTVDLLGQQIAEQRLEFTVRLAKLDEQYAMHREALLTAGEKLMATPRGRLALERWLRGGPGAYEEAAEALAEEQAARAAERDRISKAQLSADFRERITLALDAFDKGVIRRPVVLKLQEELVEAGVPNAWDLIELGRSYADGGHYVEAVAAADRALGVATTPSERSTALNDAGATLKLMGDAAGASERFAKSLMIMRDRAAGKRPGNPELGDLAVALIYVGDTENDRRRHAEALTLFREALRVIRKQLASASATDNDRRNESTSLMRIGDTLYRTEGCTKALTFYKDGLEARKRYAKSAYDSMSARRSLMIAFGNVAMAELECGDKASALDLLDKGARLARDLAEKQPDSSRAQRDLAVSLGQLGDGLALTGNPGAIAIYEETLKIDLILLAANPGFSEALNDVADDLYRLANVGAPGHSWAELVSHYDLMRARHVEPTSVEQEALARSRAAEATKPEP